jgi:hypothetical protein
MAVILIFLVGLVLLGLAAWQWGADSTEAFDSLEWERRRLWRSEP